MDGLMDGWMEGHKESKTFFTNCRQKYAFGINAVSLLKIVVLFPFETKYFSFL
jgi:hypothetical protein